MHKEQDSYFQQLLTNDARGAGTFAADSVETSRQGARTPRSDASAAAIVQIGRAHV